MYKFKIETYFKLIFFISLISLFSAYFIEYILDHPPCNLCLIGRIPYGLSILLILGYFVLKKSQKINILLLILLFAFSFISSSYHFGIEEGFFKESALCSINNTFEAVSKEELLKQLQVKNISCKDVTFRIFGLSLTIINIIISIFLIILLTKIFINYEKFKN